MATASAIPDLDRLRPAGTKRSGKRDLIVNVFLRQEGHLSADDLVEVIKREDQRISRATVYRTLQWMVEAGIARKVDFGEGRFRFEHSYRHPRHFHLICKTCNRSYEFLSSDIEALVEEVATARGFTARQSVVQIYGTCEGLPDRACAGRGRLDLRAAVRPRRAADRHCHRAERPGVLRARRAHDQGPAREEDLPRARRGGEAPPRHAGGSLPQAPGAGSAARVPADVPVLQGRGQRPLRGRRRPAARDGVDDLRGAAHRHSLRARLAPLLQALRRALRGLGGQADLPRVRRRGAPAPGTADPRVPPPAQEAADRGFRRTRPRRTAAGS